MVRRYARLAAEKLAEHAARIAGRVTISAQASDFRGREEAALQEKM